RVYSVYENSVGVTICEGESYHAGGGDQTDAGVYTDIYTTVNGCDSIIHTFLSVNPANETSVAAEICDGESYFAGGDYQTVPGVYTDSFTAINGCDSIVITDLQVLPYFTTSMSHQLCEG